MLGFPQNSNTQQEKGSNQNQYTNTSPSQRMANQPNVSLFPNSTGQQTSNTIFDSKPHPYTNYLDFKSNQPQTQFPFIQNQTQRPFVDVQAQENVQLRERIQQMEVKIQLLEKQVVNQSEQEKRIQSLENDMKILVKLCSTNFKGLCNNGHTLEFCNDFQVLQSVSCDVCKQNLQSSNIGSFRCKLCDFDRCEQCYNNGRLV